MQSGSRAHSTFKFSPPEAQVALVVVIPPIQQNIGTESYYQPHGNLVEPSIAANTSVRYVDVRKHADHFDAVDLVPKLGSEALNST
ncbi:hypothetical protein CBS63078_5315 [Aspergillus niger]|nr:hypothetical protein CBS115989_580 [Aspergillus niger]KAI2830144.1 hypothetical protein CBS133816_3739 [Aspergillus niger]KAI2850933.1 hypothetical protein CBS11350_1525 [Aspergillus niger]KAI2860649.1 hypothetical protein CBS11232_1499 [Aspergillus niger]KAI2867766.1 hypothetical protein CBS12448_212 [Aspergillus niger]